MPRVVAFLLLVLLAAAGRAQSGYAQFVADFQKAQQFKDDQLLDRSLRSHSRWAVEVYMALARDWRFGASEASQKARAQMDMLLASWGRVFKTSTLEKVERYFASVEDSVLKQIDKNQSAYEVGMRNMLEARDAKKRKDLEAAREVLWKLAETYEQVGHVVRAAECWESVAVALAALPDPSVEERRDAVFALERYKSLRESWEFTEEPQYKANIAWMKHIKDELEAAEKVAKAREARGIAGDAKGPEAVVDPNAPEIVADLQFEAMKADIEDCFIQGGAVMPNWQVVELQEGAKQLVYFQGTPLYAARVGGKYYLSPTEENPAVNGTQVQPANRPKVNTFWLDADKTRPYAMWLFVGSDKEPYMGLEQNLAPDEKRSLLFYKSAASWHATINGEEVILYDSNADGRLMTSDPYQFGLQVPNVEPGKMTTVPAYDCMQVGRKGAVQPFSEYAKIGDKWFHLRPAKDGAAISARAVVPEFLPTGTLQMKWTGPRSTHVHCLVVRGEGNLSVAAFNLASGKPVEVPAGSYVIDFGRVSEGKGSTMVTADILRGESEPIRVEAGATTVVTIGAPFTFAFEKTPQGTDVEIDAHKIRVLGAAREHYLRLNGCVPEIDVLFAKDEKGRGQKVVGSFGPVPDHDVATRLNAEFRDIGYYNPMFPIVKGAKERLTVLRFTPAGEGFVALRTAKSKVFGKIESAWK